MRLFYRSNFFGETIFRRINLEEIIFIEVIVIGEILYRSYNLEEIILIEVNFYRRLLFSRL